MSLHHGDWMKLIGGAALLATGLGAAGVGPLAGMLASGAGGAAGAGAGAAAAGAAAGGSSLGSLLAPSLISTGIGTGLSGAAGTTTNKMTSPVGVPPMDAPPDPMALFEAIKRMQHGGLS